MLRFRLEFLKKDGGGREEFVGEFVNEYRARLDGWALLAERCGPLADTHTYALLTVVELKAPPAPVAGSAPAVDLSTLY